jgi:hypothetical protein
MHAGIIPKAPTVSCAGKSKQRGKCIVLKKLLLLGLLLPLQACISIDYAPEEYVVADGRISRFSVVGAVLVNNLQPNDAKTIFFEGTSKWQGSYKSVTEHLRWQLDKEIQKNGIKKSGSDQKTIGVKVTNLAVARGAFHFSSAVDFTVSLGNGEVLEKRVTQGSPGNIWRVLNGTLALGVIDILKDERVRKYLVQ